MRRRRFLGAVGTASLVGLSGCAGINPFTEREIPTADQLEYIEYYPSYEQANTAVAVTIRLQENDGWLPGNGSVYFVPYAFGKFQAFELYTVKPNGSGTKLATLDKSKYENPKESRPQHTFDADSVSDGTVLLLLVVRSDGTKYTYGAFTKTDDGGSLQQVAYTDEDSQNNATDGS